VSLGVEPAEGNEPLKRSDENKSEDNTDSLKEDNDRVNLNVVDGLTKIIIYLVGIDQEVSAKESRESEAEEETFKVYDGLDQKENGCENSKPLEEVPVRDVTNKWAASTQGLRRWGKSRVGGLWWLTVEQARPTGGVVALNNIKWGEMSVKAKHSEIEGVENNRDECKDVKNKS